MIDLSFLCLLDNNNNNTVNTNVNVVNSNSNSNVISYIKINLKHNSYIHLHSLHLINSYCIVATLSSNSLFISLSF